MTNLLESILLSDDFKDRLNKAIKINKETSLETGFVVSKNILTADYIVQGIDISDSDKKINLMCSVDALMGFYDLISVHTHGNFKEHYIFSRHDLKSLNEERHDLKNDGVSVKPISMVATYGEDNKIWLMMLQESTQNAIQRARIEKFCDVYHKDICEQFYEKYMPTARVTSYFNKSGLYNSEIVYINDKGISPRQIRKLKRFDTNHVIDRRRIDYLVEEIIKESEER